MYSNEKPKGHIVYTSYRQEVGFVTLIKKGEWLCEANYYYKNENKFKYDVISIQPTRKKAEKFLIKNWHDNWKVSETTGIRQLQK